MVKGQVGSVYGDFSHLPTHTLLRLIMFDPVVLCDVADEAHALSVATKDKDPVLSRVTHLLSKLCRELLCHDAIRNPEPCDEDK